MSSTLVPYPEDNMPVDSVYISTEALERLMEEMANAPKEEMGKRQPGEKATYERTFTS